MWIRGVCREGDPETPQPGGGCLSKNFVLLMHPPFRRVHLPIPHSKLFEFLERLPFRQSFPAWRYPERSRIRGLTPETTQFFAGRRQNALNYRNRQPLKTFRMTSRTINRPYTQYLLQARAESQRVADPPFPYPSNCGSLCKLRLGISNFRPSAVVTTPF